MHRSAWSSTECARLDNLDPGIVQRAHLSELSADRDKGLRVGGNRQHLFEASIETFAYIGKGLRLAGLDFDGDALVGTASDQINGFSLTEAEFLSNLKPLSTIMVRHAPAPILMFQAEGEKRSGVLSAMRIETLEFLNTAGRQMEEDEHA